MNLDKLVSTDISTRHDKIVLDKVLLELRYIRKIFDNIDRVYSDTRGADV